jgi:arylsulfatase
MFSRVLLFVVALIASTSISSAAERPNLVVIVGDDIGYSDYGCYGGEIATPNIDRLAREGVRFLQFYNNAVCVPTRYSLYSGLYPRNGLATNVPTLAEILRSAGYRTSLSGKWHLGKTTPNRPIDRGFEDYDGLADGCCNQFNPAQRDPEFEGGRIRTWMRNADFIYEFPDDFYATDAISDHACRKIREFAQGDEPFFVNVCYTAAHSPLHAKPVDIAKYQGKYDAGWDALRAARHKRQIELGIVDPSWTTAPREPEFPAWEDEPLQEWNSNLMTVYAAMVDCVDQGIGRIVKTLEETGRADNTIILVFNDNGGCAEQAGGDDPTNIAGPKEHYVSCGAGWAYAQNTPFRRYKGWSHEGGIATPLVVRWPGVVKPNTITREVGHLVDLLPTFMEVADAERPAMRDDKNAPPLEGSSLLPVLRGGTREPVYPMCWSNFNNRAVRDGRWKLAWESRFLRWELYDIEADRTEMHDVSAQYPDRVAAMAGQWQAWAEKTGAISQLNRPYRLKPVKGGG